MISKVEVFTALDKKNLQVFTDKNELESWIYATARDNSVLLLMSSGTFSGINFKELSDNILRT
jgi:UDP-N-acetylmuramate: L-alanyl-gamma-D-glutamyl-meso-diaminopimelate ligase